MRAEGIDLARLASGLGAALGGGNITAAANAGGTAAEENAFWIPLIMIVGALWSAYDAVTTYREQGGEAVLQQLALDGAITVAAGGAGKVLYKVGGKVFRSGPKAWQAVKKAGLWRETTNKGLLIGLSLKQTEMAMSTAMEAYKGSTRVGHALSKHAGRNPDIWGKIKGPSSTWHGQAMKNFREIMKGPGNFKYVTNSKGITFLEKRLPDGRGLRLNQDYTFKGFID